MAKAKDYYEILGIARNASSDDIKKAYRNLAREHHPDMVKDGDKAKAEERFKEINEAYQILSDSQKKNMYDQFGHTASQQGSAGAGNNGGQWGPFSYTYSSSGTQGQGGAGNFGGFDPFDIFEDFFGFRGFNGQQARPQKGKNLYYELHIDFKDSLQGIEREVNIESGRVKIKIPVGVLDGTEMRFAGKGMPGPNGLPPGDLFITLRIRLPKEFQRAGDTLHVVVELDIVTATIGGEIQVPIIDIKEKDGVGRAALKIPAATQYGAQFRLKGKGLPRSASSGSGDVIVQVAVRVPQKLSRKQRQLLEEFRDVS